MTFKEVIETDLLTIQSTMGKPVFTFAGTDYPCHSGSPKGELVLGVGGMEQIADLVLVVRVIDLGSTTIRSQNVITFRGISYRVARVVESPTEAFYRLLCVSNTRGI